jgi:hypothetical protein
LNAGFVVNQQYVWWHSGNAQPEGQVALNFGRMKDPLIDQLLDDAHTNPTPQPRPRMRSRSTRVRQAVLDHPAVVGHLGHRQQARRQGHGTATFPAGQPGTLYDGQSFPGQIWWQQVWLEAGLMR